MRKHGRVGVNVFGLNKDYQLEVLNNGKLKMGNVPPLGGKLHSEIVIQLTPPIVKREVRWGAVLKIKQALRQKYLKQLINLLTY